MPDSYVEMYLHLVWSTARREPMLTGDAKETAYRCMLDECRKMRVRVVSVGGTADHVHLLVAMPSTVAVQELVKQIKGSSSHMMRHSFGHDSFKWQANYGAFSVSRQHVPRIQAYIARQEEHHQANRLSQILEKMEEDTPAHPIHPVVPSPRRGLCRP